MQQTSLAFDHDDIVNDRDRSGRELSLRKATGAIHIRNDISTLQRKVMDALLCVAGAQLGDRSILSHQVSLTFLCKLVDFNSNNIAHIKESIESLVARRIKWDIIGSDGEREWGVAALLADAVIRNGLVTYSFAPQLRERLAVPERWATLRMPMIRRFNSGPALAMYENCIPYRGVGQTPYFSLNMLRELLGATAESYNEFKVFNRSVLKPAVEELNRVGSECNDIQVAVEFKRTRRQVTDVKLRITSADQVGGGDTGVDERLLDQLTEDFCLGVEKAKQLLLENSAERIQEVMEYVGERAVGGKIAEGKVAGYFIRTLQNWDGSAVKRSRILEQQLADKVASTATAKVASERAAEEKAAREREAAERKEEIRRRLQALSVEERVALDVRFEEHVRTEHTPALPFLKKDGPDHPMVRAIFNAFLAKDLAADLA